MSEPYHSKSPPNKMDEELTLPRFIVMRNVSNKYLLRKHSHDETRGYLQFSGERMDSPHTKFEIEQASGGNDLDGLVHIRSCYNNKYWVCGQNQNWIIAEANEKEEDQTKRTCTLFRPVLIPFSSALSLCHVHTNFMVRCWSRTSQQPPIPNALVTSDIESPYNDCLFAGTETPENRYYDDLSFEDWDSLSILPRHIAFKGDNGLYLSASMIDERPYLKFNCENKNDQRIRNDVFNTGQGSIRIYSNAIEKFWKLSPNNWICPDSGATNPDSPDRLFQVTRIDNNTINLCNLGDNYLAYICQRYTNDNKNDCLRAVVPESLEFDPVIPEEANLQVEELVINREICNVNFHRVDYRKYDEKVLTISTVTRTNPTSNPKKLTLEFTYRKENSQTWNASVSWKKDIETKIKVGIPYMDDVGCFRVSTEVTTDHYQWGGTIITESTDLKKTHEVEVPPKTRITVSLLATEEAYDVPYSYTQRDTLINGELVEYNEDDGLYTGISTYNFLCRTTKTESL